MRYNRIKQKKNGTCPQKIGNWLDGTIENNLNADPQQKNGKLRPVLINGTPKVQNPPRSQPNFAWTVAMGLVLQKCVLELSSFPENVDFSRRSWSTST